MRWRRHFRNWLLGLLAFVLIILACLSAVVETQAGSRWLLHRVAGWVPLQLGEIHGNLLSGLDISFVDYQQGLAHFRIERASFRWRPASLLYGALSIQSLQVERLAIELPPGDTPTESAKPFTQWPRLGLPIRIELGHAQLNHIEFRQGANQQQWESLSGSVSLGTFHLRYRDLGLVHKDYSLTLSGVSDLGFPYATEASVDWRVGAEDADTSHGAAFPYKGKGKLKGDLRQLQVTATSQQPLVLKAEASLALVDDQDALILAPQLQLNVQWQQQSLPVAWWIPGYTPPVTSAELTAEGNWLAYKAHLKGELLAPDVPGLAVLMDVEGDTRQLQLKQLRLTELLPPAGDSRALSSVARKVTRMAENELETDGDSDSEGEFSHSSASVAAAAPLLIEQWLELKGSLSWLPRLEWNLEAKAEHLNAASFLVDWPSNLHMQVNSHGELDYGSRYWHLALEQLLVNGSLRDLNLELDGGLDANPEVWQSRGLRLILGANQLNIKGSLNEHLQLDWDLRAPMLGQLDTDLGGSLISQGQVRGRPQLPQVMLELTGENLAWKESQLAQVSLSIKPRQASADPSSDSDIARARSLTETSLRAASYDVLLNGRKLKFPGTYLSSFSLKGDGSANQHRVEATAKVPAYGSVELALNGSYGEADWTGSLEQASIKIKHVPRWWLVSAKPIHLAASDISVGDQCFTTRTNLTSAIENSPVNPQFQMEWNPNQSPIANVNTWFLKPQMANASPVEKVPPPHLCVQGNWQPDSGMQLDVKLDSVPLRQFYALFKPEVYFAGVMNGALKLSTKTFKLDDISARFGLTTHNAQLRYQFPGGLTEIYPWDNTFVSAQLDQGQLKAMATMQWVGFGYLEANSHINLLTQAINSGNLFARFTNLAPLETLLTDANDVSGNFSVDLKATGKLDKPEISGELNLQDGSANLPKLGLDLTGIQLKLMADKSAEIKLNGDMNSGKEGHLSLDVALSRLGSPEWTATGRLRGNDFKVINVPQLKINLNPDVRMQANAKTLRFSGEASIPWARAAIKTLPPSTTRVSNDVVMEGEDEFATVSRDDGGVEVYTNIKLALGDDVKFKGFGLDSQLGGEMQLFKDAQRRQLLTNGFVAVKKGTYKAYGQNLTIERGRLIFQGPYENPGLDIRASRTIAGEEETQVGLEIGGTLQRPSARVYSLPPHSESEAMMMLLTGKPLTQASRAEGALLMGALSGLGTESESMANGIAQFFRVDELAINSDKGIDQSELWIGKQLTPKLMVRYVVGLFDKLASLGLEYQLTDRLRVEAESGEKQSVDVIYRIER